MRADLLLLTMLLLIVLPEPWNLASHTRPATGRGLPVRSTVGRLLPRDH